MGSSYFPPSSGGASWERKTSNFTAANGGMYLVDTTGGTVTVTNPTGAVGGYYFLANYRKSWATTPVEGTWDGILKAANGPDVLLFSWDGTNWTYAPVVSDGTYTLGGGGSVNGAVTFTAGKISLVDSWQP